MPHLVKKCEQCQRSFGTYSPTARFCSRRCYAASGANRGGRVAVVETVICKWCGKPFEANRERKRKVCGRWWECPGRPPAVTSERLYFVWANMIRRAAESKVPVCAAWRSQYQAFRKWALSSGYSPGLFFRCKDKKIGYFPQNCGWGPKAQKRLAKKCEQCQRSFIPWAPTTRYCSAQCYTDSGTRGGPRAAVETAICKWCGKPFERFANRQYKKEICKRDCPARPPRRKSERLYFVWIAMKRRAADSKDPVCAAWAKHYKAFRAWALSSGYAPGLVFRRKDERIGYSPKNCGWSTKAQVQYATKKRKGAGSSRYKGVSWSKVRRLWVMQITKEGVQHTAFFPTEREAARAYDEKALELFGEFARPNFPRRKPTRQRSGNQR
jgi:hypothetical protein